LGLAAALRWHAERVQFRTGICVRLQLDEALPMPSAAVEDTLLRVTVEALCNAAKYSEARTLQVRLEGREGHDRAGTLRTTAAALTPTIRRREPKVRAGADHHEGAGAGGRGRAPGSIRARRWHSASNS